MNITEEMKRVYGGSVHLAAWSIDKDEVNRIEAKYQAAWDSGKPFGYPEALMLNGKRQDDEKELKICVGRFYSDLKGIILKNWLHRYTHEEMAAFSSLLYKGTIYSDADAIKVTIIADLTLTVQDLIHEWNAAHEGEEPIRYNFDTIPS